MTVYVDELFNAVPKNTQAKRHGIQWCHLISDGDLEELHQFAQSIGLKREYFQRSAVPHYDLTPAKRELAVKNGAIEKSGRELSEVKRSWMLRWRGGNPDWDQRGVTSNA